MKFGLEKMVRYATERTQFNKPIGDFGAMKQKIGRIASTAFALESGVYRVGADVDRKHDELKKAGAFIQRCQDKCHARICH
jgi:alkylation response protein AidB-like acyl-CoA dehydrogenase